MYLKVVFVLAVVLLCSWVVEAKLKGDDCEGKLHSESLQPVL